MEGLDVDKERAVELEERMEDIIQITQRLKMVK